MISSIPTVSFSSVNLSVPLPVIRKRQSVTVATEVEDDPTIPPRPIKRSTGSILRAKRLTAVNTISRPFIARRSKSQSPTTTESDRPFMRVTRSAQSIFKSKEQEPSDSSQPPVATANKISRALRSKYQRASIATTDTMARPVMLVKRSAQSIFKSKKTRDLNPESVVTIQELEDSDVVSLHPLSVYSPSFPSEEKPENEESSETSSLLSESSPTTSSTPSELAVALEDSIETTSLARVPSTTSAVVVISESAVPANSSYESYRWMVMMFMLTIIGVSSEFLLRRHY